MQIVLMRDLKNTVEIERRCAESNEPVFITKNGYGRLVVMDIDYYERTMRRIDEAALINRGILDYENGNTVDGKKSLKRLREKHGF
ncbi:MAG: type II toxin-antitoxin system Phd/YefM family antitoxin [Oribacterium sp.]|nr:type II toxin-antitoxin system Phd/YefM family antitoxin [Oribacterium sp.]